LESGGRIIPNVNSDKEWSALDLRDLQDGLRLGTPLEQLADFLCRDVDEVQAKIAELRDRSPP